MAKKRITQYTKQRNRVLSDIRRLKKQGYTSDYYFPTERELRKSGVKGKELAKFTRELKRLTPKVIREELVEKSRGLVPQEEDFYSQAIIQTWFDKLGRFEHGQAYNMLKNFMHRLINDNGKPAIAKALQEAAESGIDLDWEVTYLEGKARNYAGAIVRFIPDQGELYGEQMQDFLLDLDSAFEESDGFEQPD